jgi:hypothetical protein
MAYDFLAMQTRIANELHRSSLATNNHVVNAILSAIKDYERERWYFNEATTSVSLTTTASLATYTLPADFMKMDNVMVTRSGWKSKSTPMPYIEMDSRDAGNAAVNGFPQFWAIYSNLLRHYPTPDAAYTVTISYQKRLPALSASADTNAWVDDLEELIRAKAMWNLCTYVTRNAQQAAVLKLAIDNEIYPKARAENDERLMSGRLTPHY